MTENNNDTITDLINNKKNEINQEEEKMKYFLEINEFTELAIKVRENNSCYLNSKSKCIQQYAKLINELLILEKKRDYVLFHKTLSDMSIVEIKFENDETIQKMNSKIDILEKNIYDLQKYINEHTELVVIYSTNIVRKNLGLHEHEKSIDNDKKLPLICKNLKLINIISLGNNVLENNSKEKHVLPLFTNEKFNDNFKLIKCEKLTIDSITHDINYENLPETIEIIELFNLDGRYMQIFIQNIYRANIPKLHTLIFNKCTDLKKIYNDLVLHLSIKTVKIQTCPYFEEKNLLLNNGINFIKF